jgi:hypothetical protein
MKTFSLSILSAGLLLPVTGVADVLSQDTFSAYTTGAELPGQNPAINGYLGAWTDIAFGDAEPAVMAGSLTYAGANYAPGSGQKVGKTADAAGIGAGNSGRVQRLLESSLAVTNATSGTLYLSWLFQTGNENTAANPNTYQTLALWNGTAATDGLRDFEAGIASGDFATGNYGFRVDSNAPANLGIAADSNVHLFVAKFVLSSAALSDSVTVWIDPVLGAGEPVGGVTVSGKDIAWDRLVFSDYASNSSNWDDIRWGTTFNSVTTEAVVPAIPVFDAQPSTYSGSVGTTFTLQAGASASPAPTYQWQKSADGIGGWANIGDATANSLEFISSTYADRGFYRVIATNANGSATSNVVEVDLAYPAPTIAQQPVSASVETGSDVFFFVTASGLGNLTYQWYKDEDPIAGEITDQLQLTGVQADDEGDYWVRITDDAATVDGQPVTTVDSQVATLDVFPPPSGLISYDPFDIAAGYVAGELPGQNPAVTGYFNGWTDVDFGDAEPAISTGSLAYPDPFYLGSSGDKVSVVNNVTGGDTAAAGSGRAFRLLEGPLQITPASSGTRYLSFLFRSGQETGATVYQMLHLNQGNGDGNRNFDLGLTNNSGQPGTEYNFGVDGTYTSTAVTADTNVHLFVVKFDLSADSFADNVTVWVDPDLGGGDPAGGTMVTGAELAWDRLCLSDYDGNSAAWDEIRWGTTFESVTLNPNPPANFAAWIGGFNVGSLNGFNDDADGDGIKNGLENVFGTNPSVANQGVTAVAKTGSTVTFRHPQSGFAASDVTAAYKWSTDLATFHASGAASGGTTVTIAPALNTPSAGTTTVTATISGSQPAKLFLTLEATKAP